MKHKAFPVRQFKALADEGEGVFEAIVATWDIDRQGHKIIRGAFAADLVRWAARGWGIPVVFSHKHDDIDALIGAVTFAEERPEGLFVRGRLDLAEDFARKVWKKMKAGLLTTFSFAYLITKSKVVNGINELRELEILELGPTLIAVNPAAHLIGVKQVGLKPEPNEHACRLRPPSDFEADSFRRVAREHEGKEYAVIVGRLEGEEAMTEQAYRYSIDDWEAAQASSHCADHDGTFEPAEPAEPPSGKTWTPGKLRVAADLMALAAGW